MLNVYVTSTIHNEGKTFLTAGLAVTMQSLGYNTNVYKPVQTAGIEMNGFMQSPDLTYIKTLDPYIGTHFTYLFKNDTEPLIAAEKENKYIDLDLILSDYKKINEKSDCTIVDGEGGILTPVAAAEQNVDLIKKIKCPVVFAVTPDKNAINNTLCSIYAALDKKVKIRGVIINNIKEDCPKELLTSITRVIEEYSGVNILGLLPAVKRVDAPEEIINNMLNGVDIEGIFGVKIEKLGFN